MSLSETLSNFVHGVEAEAEKVIAEIEGAPVVADIKTDVVKLEAAVPAVVAKVEVDYKALALEAVEFFKTIPQRFVGDAVYDHAQAFIAKVAADL